MGSLEIEEVWIDGDAGKVRSVFNCMNVIVGCGIVGLPYALSKIGWGFFALALVCVASYSLFSMFLLLKALESVHKTSYEDVAYAAFKLPGKVYTSSVIFLSCQFAMCSYMFIVKNQLPPFIRGLLRISGCDKPWYIDETIVVLIVIWLIVAPLCIPREVNFLGFTSGLGMFCMVGFAIIVLTYTAEIECPLSGWEGAHKFMADFEEAANKTSLAVNETAVATDCILAEKYTDEEKEFYEVIGTQNCESQAFTWGAGSINAIPTMVFAFQFQAGALPVYHELKGRSVNNMLKVAGTAVLAVFLMYGSVALAAYFSFFNITRDDVLIMYSSLDASGVRILLARAAVLICVIFSAPLLHFACRKTQIMVMQRPGVPYTFNMYKHLGWALVNMLITTLVVLYAPGIEVMFTYGGAVTANSIVIILPAAFYWQLIERPKPENERSLLYYICPGISMVGIVFMLYMIIHEIIKATSA